MKRGMDRGFEEEDVRRDPAPQGPLRVEPLGSQDPRRKFVVPLVVAFIVLVAVGATIGRFLPIFIHEAGTPAPPTPVSWVDTTVAPTVEASPTATPSGPAPSTTPSETTPTPSPTRPLNLKATATPGSFYWNRGLPNHFTVELTNTTGGIVTMSPCPTYRMYVQGSDPALAPIRVLNCAGIGEQLLPGQAVSLDMVYTISASDPPGYQTIQWEAVSRFQAIAIFEVAFASD
jgi:hypothetical protein